MLSVLLMQIDSWIESSFYQKHPQLPLVSGTDLNGAEVRLELADPYFVLVMGFCFQTSLCPQD